VAERVRAGVTGWVCAADHQAYDLIAALKTRGLNVGEHFSVTGFDGIEKPDWAPLLTTAVIPYREIGYTGGRRLFDLMQKRFGSPQHILVASRLRQGETVAPVGTLPAPEPAKRKKAKAAAG
jgi:LacI family transcriptional regulator